MTLERWRPTRALAPWNLFSELEEFERRFDDLFGSAFWPFWRRRGVVERTWAPALEVIEKDDRYIVKAELPGLKPEEVDISIADDALTIKGEKRSEEEVKQDEYHWTERTYGAFQRVVRLPSNVDTGKVEATYEHGVLQLTLPKKAEVAAKKIKVKVGKDGETAKKK